MALADRLRTGFVTGLVLVAPLAVTVVVLQVLYGWVVGFISPLLSVVRADASPAVELVAVGVLGLAVTALGVVVRRGVGDYAVSEFDDVMQAIPGVRAIYASARQASNALVGQEENFERVALVEWPGEGVHTVGFVTDETPADVAAHLDGEGRRYNVFVPMAPNPMGGFLAVVPESRVRMTDMSVSEGLQLVVTTGMSGDGDPVVETVRP